MVIYIRLKYWVPRICAATIMVAFNMLQVHIVMKSGSIAWNYPCILYDFVIDELLVEMRGMQILSVHCG